MMKNQNNGSKVTNNVISIATKKVVAGGPSKRPRPAKKSATTKILKPLSDANSMIQESMMDCREMKVRIDTLYSWQMYLLTVIEELKIANAKHRPNVALSTRIVKLLRELSNDVEMSFLDPWSAPSELKAAFQSSNELFLILFELTENSKKTAVSGSMPGVHPLEAVDGLIMEYIRTAYRCGTAELNESDDCMSLKVGPDWIGAPSVTHAKLIALVRVEFPDDDFRLTGLDVFIDGEETGGEEGIFEFAIRKHYPASSCKTTNVRRPVVPRS